MWTSAATYKAARPCALSSPAVLLRACASNVARSVPLRQGQGLARARTPLAPGWQCSPAGLQRARRPVAAGEAPGAEPHRGNEAEGTNPQPSAAKGAGAPAAASPTLDTGANSASAGPAPSFAGLGPLAASLVWPYFCFKLCLFVTLIPGAGFASVAEDFANRKLSTLPLPLMRALSITLFFMMSSPVSSALRWLAGFGEQWLFAANALAAAFLVHLAMGATSLAFPAILKALLVGRSVPPVCGRRRASVPVLVAQAPQC